MSRRRILSIHRFKSSLGDFKIEAEKQGVAKDVELVYLDRGDTYEFYPRIESDKAMEAV